jgi:hypothetical protein
MLLTDLAFAYPLIQPLDHGNFLLAATQCFKGSASERNGVIYGENGQVLDRFMLGAGINNMQVACDQHIWVSFFDEGVSGSNNPTTGWKYAIGEPGLVCFTLNGEITWKYTAPSGFRSIDDCYALNVADDAVWIYYYQDFPIVKITRDKQVHGWVNAYRGAKILVVDNQNVLLWGGYLSDNPTRGIIQTIDGDRLINRPYRN